MSNAREYRGQDIMVSFDARRCAHAAECVKGLPQVFDTQAKPWIQPDKAAAEAVAATVARCPTGALKVRWPDGRVAPAPAKNEAQIQADGPLMMSGRLEVCDAAGTPVSLESRLALCRCGASQNKPYCDGSHAGVGFGHDGGCASVDVKAVGAGALKLTVSAGGPVQCDGPLEIRDAFGEVVYAGEQCWLCRCGASQNKPFCDGSHKGVGFAG